MSAPELRGERVRLRGWREHDLAPYLAMLAEPEVAYWLGGPYPPELITQRFGLMRAALDARGWGMWAIEDETGEMVGAAGLQPVTRETRLSFAPAIEVAWRLKRAAWGRGLVSEAMKLAMAHSGHLPEVAWLPLVSFTTESNVRSQAVMRRLGLIRDPDGDFDHPTLAADHPLRRHVLYRMPG